MLLAAVLAGDLRAQPQDSLWISDDVQVRIYHVSLDGTLLGSFHSGSISGLSLGFGARDATVWGAKEGSNLIVKYDKQGNQLSTLSCTVFDPAAGAPEGVAVDPVDASLWIVDDDTQRVYNVERDGTLISSFSLEGLDPAIDSPQDIAVDPSDGTLWLTDNGFEGAIELTRDGQVLGSIHVSSFAPAALNLQGLCVDPADRTLWLTDRATHTIYKVSQGGVLVASLDATLFGSANPTGVAYDVPLEPTLPGLLGDIAQGVEDGQIGPGPAERIGQLVKLAIQYEKGGDHHPAVNHLLAFHAVVGSLSGRVIDADLAQSLQASTMAVLDAFLDG
jgi:sugar lactone lactonase YvrE